MSWIHNIQSYRRDVSWERQTNYIRIFVKESDCVCGSWDGKCECYSSALGWELSRGFISGSLYYWRWDFRKPLKKRREGRLKAKGYSKNNEWHEWDYKWEKHHRGKGRRWECREGGGFLAPPHLLHDNLKKQKSGGWEGSVGNSKGNLGKPLNLILRVWAKKHKLYGLH